MLPPVAAPTMPAQNLAAGATQAYALQIPIADAALWSPQIPDLYRVVTGILVGGQVVDAVTITFGIRSLKHELIRLA